MPKKSINKANPLEASPALNGGAKKDAKVNATSERLARSMAFSAYSLRWNSFICILNGSITSPCCLSRDFRGPAGAAAAD